MFQTGLVLVDEMTSIASWMVFHQAYVKKSFFTLISSFTIVFSFTIRSAYYFIP